MKMRNLISKIGSVAGWGKPEEHAGNITSEKVRFQLSDYSDSSIPSTLSQQQIQNYNEQRTKGPQPIICYAPFNNLYFSRHGEVYVCCHNRNYTVGRYPDQQIDEIWNGNKIEQLRKYIACNNLSLGCQTCQYDFDRGSYGEVRANHFDQLPFNGYSPSMMEFELSNTCNLECQMCSGEFFSALRKNRDNLPKLQSPYDAAFVEQLKPYLHWLKEARFSGGEPFLIAIYFDIWEHLTKVNPNCLISVQTNGTILNQRTKSILEKGRFEIGISLDSLNKKTFESIRANAYFETVMENLTYFSEYCQRKQTPLRLSMCVMNNNWWEMPEMLKHCNKLTAYVSFHRVVNPESLAIWNLTPEKLKKVYEYLSGFDFKTNATNNIQQDNAQHYEDYLALIEQWWKQSMQTAQNEKRLERANAEELKQELKASVTEALKMTQSYNQNNVDLVNCRVDLLLSEVSGDLQRELLHKILKQDQKKVVERLMLNDIDKLRKEIKQLL